MRAVEPSTRARVVCVCVCVWRGAEKGAGEEFWRRFVIFLPRVCVDGAVAL